MKARDYHVREVPVHRFFLELRDFPAFDRMRYASDRELAVIDEAKQRIEWNQARDGDIARLARVCSEYEALVSNVNGNAAPKSR